MRAKGMLRAGCLLAALGCTTANAHDRRDLGRETLPAENGWAASGGGVTGGAAAGPEHLFVAPRSFTAGQILSRLNGTALSASGTLLVGPPVRNPVDVIAAWNDSNDPDLGVDAGWVPMLNYQLSPAWTTALTVPLFAGPMFW